MFNRPPGEPQRSNPTTPTGAAPPTPHQFPLAVYNDTNFSNASKHDDQDSSDSSSHSSPSPQANSFTSSGYNYNSGYQHPYGHYSGVSYAPPYGMGVAPPNSAKSPVASSPSAMTSHFMFGSTYNSVYNTQGNYGSYPYLGLNNGGPARAAGINKDGNSKGEDEVLVKPNFNSPSEQGAVTRPQSKSPKSLLT